MKLFSRKTARIIALVILVILFGYLIVEFQFSEINYRNRDNPPALDSVNPILKILKQKNKLAESTIKNKNANFFLAQYFLDRYRKTRRRSFYRNHLLELLRSGRPRDVIVKIKSFFDENNVHSDVFSKSKYSELFYLLGLAYFRLGNCTRSPERNSCILPIEGSFKANRNVINIAKKMFSNSELFQNKKTWSKFQYLVNLAYMKIGWYPEKVPEKFLIEGLAPRIKSNYMKNMTGKSELGLLSLAGDSLLADFNKDGLLDVATSSYPLDHQFQIYLNSGNLNFRNVTHQLGLEGVTGGRNFSTADINNDGYRDIYLSRGNQYSHLFEVPDSVLIRSGNGTYHHLNSPGDKDRQNSKIIAWSDVNRDGKVDYFRAGSKLRNPKENSLSLYLNQNGRDFKEVETAFDDITDTSAISGATWTYYDDDVYPDLYISRFEGSNQLFKNQYPDTDSNWFKEVTIAAGVEKPNSSFSTWSWDYNNDGLYDLFVAGFDAAGADSVIRSTIRGLKGKEVTVTHPRLFKNTGNGTYRDVTDTVGLNTVGFVMGSNYGDLNSDGYLDLYLGTGNPSLPAVVPNRYFRNQNGKSFLDRTFQSGLAHVGKGHGISFGDVNNDGFQDVYAVFGGAYEGDLYKNKLFVNPGNSNDWISLKLQGDTVNYSAIGARVEIQVITEQGQQRSIYRTVSAGSSFGNNSLQLEVGLGSIQTIKKILINWPNKKDTQQKILNIKPNKRYRVVQGKSPRVVHPGTAN